MILQYIISILAVIAIAQGYSKYSQAKQTLRVFLFWSLSWIFMILVVVFPSVTTSISNFLNIQRPIDAVLVPSIIVLYYIMFIIYVKIGETEKNITRMVRKEALRNINKK